MAFVGELLKKSRISEKINIETVSKDLNISVDILNNIEDDNFPEYLDKVYLIGHIRTYSKYLDLNSNEVTDLQIIPFAYMDGVLKDYMKLDVQMAITKIKDLKNEVKDVSGCFVGIWHNESLGEQGRWKGWREVYESSFSSS